MLCKHPVLKLAQVLFWPARSPDMSTQFPEYQDRPFLKDRFPEFLWASELLPMGSLALSVTSQILSSSKQQPLVTMCPSANGAFLQPPSPATSSWCWLSAQAQMVPVVSLSGALSPSLGIRTFYQDCKFNFEGREEAFLLLSEVTSLPPLSTPPCENIQPPLV